ncbi:hypothetical protein BVG16_26460 [Paenibacillus selenitireducens]|jgi:uncharacterized protein YnzC (UPF0291/DUF896 family)|uniref:UPF0291 protein BVG16_26460 n=1 Tax=Paenibacillus selenitireducens TaxID=1324314 RepID=A0A1T2X2D7_9BACL|nr:DUF896 domain-containing protein [Paenibacillus selenitireducens]OPA73985.1 hypothetical protein BVG16_26460 [Paenibacillus selenitireducens]
MVIPYLNRINELSRKEKQAPLTAAEKEEQLELRQRYLKEIRGSMENTVLGLTVIDPIGNDVTPNKLKAVQIRKNYY